MDSKALIAAGIGALVPLLIGLLFIGPQVMEQRAAEWTADLPALNARLDGVEKLLQDRIKFADDNDKQMFEAIARVEASINERINREAEQLRAHIFRIEDRIEANACR